MSTRTTSLPERQTVLDIARHAGGVASVFLGHPAATADPAARWHTVTGLLTRVGAEADLVGAVERALQEAPAPAPAAAARTAPNPTEPTASPRPPGPSPHNGLPSC